MHTSCIIFSAKSWPHFEVVICLGQAFTIAMILSDSTVSAVFAIASEQMKGSGILTVALFAPIISDFAAIRPSIEMPMR